ncbi:hypothetical protein KY331_05385 [Candidatus Woesearchaeota archaeon]|nr:hypothetical protein [Candidatus Woesearchaeota archaeon]
MAKEAACTCPICGTGLCKGLALIALIVGILFLLQDLGIWAFWNISWYTVGFILVGLCFILHKCK